MQVHAPSRDDVVDRSTSAVLGHSADHEFTSGPRSWLAECGWAGPMSGRKQYDDAADAMCRTRKQINHRRLSDLVQLARPSLPLANE